MVIKEKMITVYELELMKERRDALLEALKDLVQAHDVGMGRSALALRIDLARYAIEKAKGG